MDTRVAVVVRPVDRALRLSRFVLLALLLLTGSVPLLAWLTSARASGPLGAEVVLAALAAGAITFALLQSEAVGGRIDRVLAGVRRRVALACNHVAVGAHRESRVGCYLTPGLLRAPLFPYDTQRQVVEGLMAACAATEDEGRYWVVEGESGTGKTRTGLLLVQALARHRRLYELGSRCFLYDLNRSPKTEDELVGHLGSRRHDDAVVLVDNFQQIGRASLDRITHYLLEGGGGTERLVVLLTRPSHSWRLGGGADVRLVADAKTRGRFQSLEGPRRETIERLVAAVDPAASQLLGDLESNSIASATQLHLAQAIARGHTVAPELLDVLGLVAGQREQVRDALAPTLGAIGALAAHTGRFTRRELWGAARLAAGSPRAAVRVVLTFRRLRRLGFVSRAEHDDAQYVFHESVAEYCIDRVWQLPAFRDAFVRVARARLTKLADVDLPTAWLLATECDAQAEMAACFDGAMAHGSYHRMAQCLQRSDRRYPLTEHSQLQLAILLNRIGEFTASRRLFADSRIGSIRAAGDLALMLLTSRMEATHDAPAEDALVELQQHDDPLVATIGEYWRIHMAAHRGQFDSARLLALADQAREWLRDDHGYWLVYSLARMHFDSLRHRYLEGAPPMTAEEAATRRRIARALRGRLPTYEALNLVYEQAHLVSHVLLPRLAIFRERIATEDARLADVPSAAAHPTVDHLVATAERHYTDGQMLFGAAGDREAWYLAADVLNAKMVATHADRDTVTRLLEAYEAFGEEHFKLIRSYPHYYWMKWHILEFFRCLAAAGDTHAATHELNLARARLTQVEALDRAVGNEYGVLRARLLGFLLDLLEGPIDLEALECLRQSMVERSYGFEARLLSHVAAQASDMTHTDLLTIFRFYPFVHQ
jgi:hypothetical protein